MTLGNFDLQKDGVAVLLRVHREFAGADMPSVSHHPDRDGVAGHTAHLNPCVVRLNPEMRLRTDREVTLPLLSAGEGGCKQQNHQPKQLHPHVTILPAAATTAQERVRTAAPKSSKSKVSKLRLWPHQLAPSTLRNLAQPFNLAKPRPPILRVLIP